MSKNAYKILFFISTIVSAQITQPTSAWVYQKKTDTLKVCYARAVGHASGNSFDAIVSLEYASGRDKNFAINILIPNASKFKHLDLGAIGDPDRKKIKNGLVFLNMASNKKYYFPLEGSLTAEFSDDEFTMPIYCNDIFPIKQNKLIRQMLADIGQHPSSWRISISNPQAQREVVEISLSFSGAAPFVEECIKSGL